MRLIITKKDATLTTCILVVTIVLLQISRNIRGRIDKTTKGIITDEVYLFYRQTSVFIFLLIKFYILILCGFLKFFLLSFVNLVEGKMYDRTIRCEEEIQKKKVKGKRERRVDSGRQQDMGFSISRCL